MAVFTHQFGNELVEASCLGEHTAAEPQRKIAFQ